MRRRAQDGQSQDRESKFRRSDDFSRIPAGSKLGKSMPVDMIYTTGSLIPSELRTQQQQKATAPSALYRPVVKNLQFEINKPVKVTRLRYTIGATGPDVSYGIRMTDAHAKDDVKELDEEGHLPIIMQFGHQEADRIKAQTQPPNPEQNPIPLDIGETLYVFEYAWVKNRMVLKVRMVLRGRNTHGFKSHCAS